MNKAYNRINWENYPSDSTPLNEDNLNKMDIAINEVDNRVISLDTTKLPVATAYTMVKDVEFDEKTGVFTITKLNGSVIKIDTALEKISTNFRFDHSTQKLILTLIDGTTQEVDLSALLTQYEFTDSDTIAFTIDTSGKVVASVKKGSITQDMLEPNYLANIKVEVAKAESASLSADTSAKNAETSAINAKNSEEKAKEYAQAASGEAILEIQTIVGGEIDENTGETNVEYSVPQESEGKWSLSTVFGGSVVNALKQATKAITEEFVKISDYFAKKSLYDDTTINVGRKADSTVGRYSTAEGYFNIASKNCAHAEGEATIAGEYCAHAEGSATTANGECSHVEGYETIASGIFSHVQGKYNVEDTENKYAHIVGGGISDTERKNIHTLDWEGNAVFAGDVIAHDESGNEISLRDVTDSLKTVEKFELIPADGVTFSTNQCIYNRATGRVDVIAECTCSNAIGTGTAFATIPSEYLPKIALFGQHTKMNGNIAPGFTVSVSLNGNIVQWGTGGLTQLQFTISYYV